MAELFQKLESNNPAEVQTAKDAFREQFNSARDPWLLNGLYDYYLATNSVRSMEILVNIREQHHVYLFEKLSDSIRSSKTETKVQALTLLGHVLRKQPTWIYRITEHHLLKDILKLLKVEMEIIPLVSALLVLVVLLPIIPALMRDFLEEVFDIFSRLAAWNCNNPGKLVEEQLVHMQVALYALFLRLYGMYPCNFLGYLRKQYRDKDLLPVFTHTIKPMLDTVKMNPSLVTASKDNETTTARWKKMGVHDVIVECERLSLDVNDRCPHESCHYTTSFRSRSGTTNSGTLESPYPLQSFKNISLVNVGNELDFYSPSMMFHIQTPPIGDSGTSIPLSHMSGVAFISTSRKGTSPPEAAIEATPETTPIKDIRTSRPYPASSGVVKALNSFTARNWSVGSGTTTPTHSQPSSPMRKEASPFNFPSDGRPTSAFSHIKRDSYATQKLQRIIQDRNQINDGTTDIVLKSSLPFNAPTSPLRIIPPHENIITSSLEQRISSPVTQEDEEVVSIVRLGESTNYPLRQCDSVLQEVERGEEDLDDCEKETGSPCNKGGLHMPNSTSLNNFAKQISRLRYYSQCAENDHQKISTGSSPGKSEPYPDNPTVRRANSCPEMKKSHVVPTKDNTNKILDEACEENNTEIVSNGVISSYKKDRKVRQKLLTTCETQTENFWPMPYEHMFLSIFPSLENADIKPSSSPSPAPNLQLEKYCPPVSVNDILDRYIENAVQSTELEYTKHLKDQLQLLHQQLLFERHRRETHAFRNRRLLADARNTRAFEEHNSALRDQVQLQQRDIDSLKQELEIVKKDGLVKEKEAADKILFWEYQCKSLQEECKSLRENNSNLKSKLEHVDKKCIVLDKSWQEAEAALLDATAEVKIAKEQAWAGERGRAELEQVNRQLLLAGELNLKYEERLAELSLIKRCDQEIVNFKESYNHELKGISQQLEARQIALEACKTRVTQLEQMLVLNDDSITVLKRKLNEIKEECDEKLQAVESKYQTQLAVNRTLEERMLDLWQRVDLSGRRGVYSPDTSSCHEVNPTMTDRTSIATGLSPHSSPLSASLASSEGSVAFMHPDVRDMKNLQVIVDQKESTAPSLSKSNDHASSNNEAGPSGHSQTKHD